jgi:arylsulfatase
MPDKLAQMKEIFIIEAARNKALPIGGGLWVLVLHPEMRITPPYDEWEFTGDITRMPEFTAPALGNRPNVVTIKADIPEYPDGVLYALGGAGGGLTCFVEDGILCYEYNLFLVMRTKIRTKDRLLPGPSVIEVETTYVDPKPGGPLEITLKVNGVDAAKGTVPVSAPLLFSANDCLDIGTCLGSPISLDYSDKAPFPFNGTIDRVHVKYTK